MIQWLVYREIVIFCFPHCTVAVVQRLNRLGLVNQIGTNPEQNSRATCARGSRQLVFQ
jgi:hypothetical protein